MPETPSSESVLSFWKWFSSHQSELFSFERDQEKLFQQLTSQLELVHRDLTFEFGPVQDGKRDFVISAGGIKSAFASVEAIHTAAPKLTQWTFVKFRPRRSPIHDLEFEHHNVKASGVHFAIFKDEDPKKVGIMLFLDGYSEAAKSTWGQIGYLFLDEALGEFDVEMHVGAIMFFDRASKYFDRAKPLAELPSAFDHVIRPERTKKP